MKYNERIEMIYATYLSEIPRNSDVSYIYSLSDKIYDEITNLNVQVDLCARTILQVFFLYRSLSMSPYSLNAVL